MRHKGQIIKNDNIRYVVIPRPSGDITFIAKPVVSFDVFDELCPAPKPPTITTQATGLQAPDFTDVDYQLNVIRYNSLRSHWLIITSIKESPDITWDTVDYNKPDTWVSFLKELEDACFTPAEINAITSAVIDVNSLNDAQLEEARNRFLAANTAQQDQ